MSQEIYYRNLYSRMELISFLEEISHYAEGLGLNQNPLYSKKIKLIEQMKNIITERDLPVLNKTGDWCYKIQCTMYALYLNMVITEERRCKLKENEKSKGYGYNLIKLTGRLLTIEQFAQLNNTTEDAVRKQLRIGQLPYAKKFGSAWLIPEFSTPIKDEKLSGWFQIYNDTDNYITQNGLSITIPKYSTITVLPNGRTSDNKKIFTVTINNFDPITEIPENSIKYDIGLNDKNKFLFQLISNPNINYHSDDIGLAAWLFNY